MVAKLCLVLVLAIAAISCAQASLDKYLNTPATGEDQVRQLCFVKLIIQEALDGDRSRKVRAELKSDLDEMKKFIDDNYYNGSPSASTCATSGYRCSRVGWNDFFARSKVDQEQIKKRKICDRWETFTRLEKKIKGRNSDDKRVLAIEEWVRQVAEQSYLQLRRDPHTFRKLGFCRDDVKKLAEEAANKKFYEVFSYSEEDLERAKKALAVEIDAEMNSEESPDTDEIERVHQMIKERVANHFDEFDKCWADRDLQKADKKKQKKGLLAKMF